MAVEGTLPTTTLVMLCGLIPIPFVDTLLQNAVRRRYVQSVSKRWDLDLTADEVKALADAPLAPGKRVFVWGLKKVLGRLLWPVAALSAARQARETWGLGHRALATRAMPMPEPMALATVGG